MELPTVTASAAATWAGRDSSEAARTSVGELPVLPVLPLLAARGLGADLVGRTAAMLEGMPVDVTPRAWRLSDAVGWAGRRAADFLDRDLDAIDEALERARGARVDSPARTTPVEPGSANGAPGGQTPGVRVELMGPWSLAARLELPNGRPVLSDAGARRDVAESLREGLTRMTAQLVRRLGVAVRLVLVEPELWRVIAGAVPAPSELDPVAAIPAERVGAALAAFAAQLHHAARPGTVAAVVVDAPARATAGVPTNFPTLAVGAAGTPGMNGLVMDAAQLLPWASMVRPHGWADGARDPEAHGLLDTCAAVLDAGGVLEVHRAHRLCSAAQRMPEDLGGAETVAAAVVQLLNRLAVDQMAALAQLSIVAGAPDMAGDANQQRRALHAARHIAEVLPRIAQ